VSRIADFDSTQLTPIAALSEVGRGVFDKASERTERAVVVDESAPRLSRGVGNERPTNTVGVPGFLNALVAGVCGRGHGGVAAEASGVGSGGPGGVAVGAGRTGTGVGPGGGEGRRRVDQADRRGGGLSSSRVHQVVADADVDALDIALGVLRSAGWPAPEDPGVDDGDLGGRADIAGRLDDEVELIRQCADWLEHLDREPYPAVVNLRPESDGPRRFQVAADLPRVVAILRRIAYDVHELARSRRVDDLDQAAVAGDPRAERRRRAAEPALEFIAFCRRRTIATPQLERAYDAWNAERYERGETDQGSWEACNPVREARNRPGNWTL
jgi:hypothetical protein